jgi:pimeloyl-ACP methyl ester carboxylesterase
MSTFVLVHGGFHGGWCWEPLAAALESRGHLAIAPDLPCDEPQAGYAEYVSAVVDAIDRRVGAGDPEPLVLVGHSLGCYTVPLVAECRPAARLVLLCAVPALPGAPIPMDEGSILTDDLLHAKEYLDESGLAMQSPATFNRLFYEDCDPASAWSALVRLRPQGRKPLTEPWPLQRWPEVPTTLVLARHDNVVAFERALEPARRFLGGREPIVLDGGHSLFLTQVDALVELLTGSEPAGNG